MHDTHLAALDLNLLRVLDAILITGSVSRAATRLGLSQSATSHALARLRQALGDPLLVRTGSLLQPTARASALAEPLRAALAALSGALAPPPHFDPATSRAKFVLGMADYTELTLIPKLLKHMTDVAPNVNLWVQPATAADALEAPGSVLGLLLAHSKTPTTASFIRKKKLFSDRFVCALRRGHPALQKKWTPKLYSQLSHVLIAPRGTPGGAVDEALAEHGLTRRVVIGIPHFLVAPHLVSETDLVVTLPESVARAFARWLPLELMPPPIPIPGFSMSMFWPERLHADPGHIWLRDSLVTLSANVFT